MVMTKMNWSGSNVVENHNLDLTNSLRSSPNQFGLTKTILDRPKLFWSHRRTRHESEMHQFESSDPVVDDV